MRTFVHLGLAEFDGFRQLLRHKEAYVSSRRDLRLLGTGSPEWTQKAVHVEERGGGIADVSSNRWGDFVPVADGSVHCEGFLQ